MDTSKEYILMCEEAKEIQNLKRIKYGFELKYGDYFTMPDRRIDICLYQKSPKFDLGSGMIFLPRQDQLQEMVKPNKYNSYWLVQKMYEFVNEKNAGELTGNPSCEQLWLAFVMHEKYGKTWDGEEWVKTQEGKR